MHDDRLHELLVARHSLAELARKQRKAQRRGIYTQEDIDWAKRSAFRYRHIWEVTPVRLPGNCRE